MRNVFVPHHHGSKTLLTQAAIASVVDWAIGAIDSYQTELSWDRIPVLKMFKNKHSPSLI